VKGASRGDNRVVTGLADRERAAGRVAGPGGLVRNARSINPQNAKRCRPLNGKRPQLSQSWGRNLSSGGLGAETGRLAKPAAGL
jgi:hypothetical protein